MLVGSSCSRAVGGNRVSEQEEGRGKLTHGGGDWGSLHGGVPDVGILPWPACPAGAGSCHGILLSLTRLDCGGTHTRGSRENADSLSEC